METHRTLEEVVQQLPRAYQAELYDFAEFLLERSRRKPSGRPGFGWAGALKDLRAEYSSVELQHEAAPANCTASDAPATHGG